MTLRQALEIKAALTVQEAINAGATWEDLANAKGIMRRLEIRNGGDCPSDNNLRMVIDIATTAKRRAIRVKATSQK